MLKLLIDIFGFGKDRKKYPKALVNEALEKTIDGTDPWLRAVGGYKRKLRPAILRSLDHVAALVNSLAPPIHAHFNDNGSSPSLAAFFVSTNEMLDTFRSDRTLNAYLQEQSGSSGEVVALLMMEKHEKTIFGAELTGDVVVRDVPQLTVNFLSHRIQEPSENEELARRRLERKAFDHLVGIAHQHVADIKSKRKDLERRRTLLQSKLGLMQRGIAEYADDESAGLPSRKEIEEQLGQLVEELRQLGGDDRMLDTYLNAVIGVLSHPEEHIWETKQCLILDHQGIKRTHLAGEDDCEITLHEFFTSQGRRWVLSLIALPLDELRRISQGTPQQREQRS